jgi:glycosyltransferase involved in cell wall biosynthesis
MTRVLHVCESTEGGVGTFVVALARHQVAAGLEVSAAGPSGGPRIAELERIGVRCLPWEAVPQPGPTVPTEMRSLALTLNAVDPDVLHLHSSKAGMVGRLLVRRQRPTVMQPHAWSFFAKTGAMRRATLRWERVAARWTDVMLCVSEDERRLGQEFGVRGDYRVVPNGVDLEGFMPASETERRVSREQLGLPVGAPIAVCAGRLHRQKNQAALLDAWPHVRSQVLDARLVLVGDGPDRPELKARAVEGVELAGHAADVRPWLAAANVVVQPSRWEGMSIVLLEALARARSVVVTDVPGMREVVVGRIGTVVPPDDPPALVAAIVTRLADPEGADAEGRAGRLRAEEHHDRRRQHAAIGALYTDLLERSERQGGRASKYTS